MSARRPIEVQTVWDRRLIAAGDPWVAVALTGTAYVASARGATEREAVAALIDRLRARRAATHAAHCEADSLHRLALRASVEVDKAPSETGRLLSGEVWQ